MPHRRGAAFQTVTDDIYAGRKPDMPWGPSQYRASSAGSDWNQQKWLYAWENPYPDSEITGITVKHHSGKLFLMGVTAGNISEHPLRYGRRRKFAFSLESENENANPLDLADIDLGHIISVIPRPFYNNQEWEKGYNNQQPEYRTGEYIVEFNAHDDAVLYVGNGENKIAVEALSSLWLPEYDFSDCDELSDYFSYELEIDDKIVSSGTVLFCMPKHYSFKDPELSVKRSGKFITVEAEAYAKSVEIYSDDEDFVLSDNYFDINGDSITVEIIRGDPKHLKARSVYEIGR